MIWSFVACTADTVYYNIYRANQISIPLVIFVFYSAAGANNNADVAYIRVAAVIIIIGTTKIKPNFPRHISFPHLCIPKIPSMRGVEYLSCKRYIMHIMWKYSIVFYVMMEVDAREFSSAVGGTRCFHTAAVFYIYYVQKYYIVYDSWFLKIFRV